MAASASVTGEGDGGGCGYLFRAADANATGLVFAVAQVLRLFTSDIFRVVA